MITIKVDASDLVFACKVLRDHGIFFNISGFGGIMVEKADEYKAYDALHSRKIQFYIK